MWSLLACVPPLGEPVLADASHDFDHDGFDEAHGDCDDDDPTVVPPCDSAAPVPDTATDTDTDTDTETPPAPDADDDGVPDELDCDDADPQIHPGHVEVCDDGVDQDCDDVDPACHLDGEIAPDVQYFEWAQEGWPLWSAGDQDGDGLPELLVGNLDLQRFSVVDYQPGGLGTLSPVATIRGPYGYFGLGQSGQGVADMTGDGLDDLLIGGPFALSGPDDGVVWVLPGPISGVIDPVSSPPAGTLSHIGGTWEQYGEDVEATDFDGDGALDLVGAADAGGHGAVYVSYGPLPEFSTVSDEAVRAAVFVRYQYYGGDAVGADVEPADLDADGVGDLVFSSRGDAYDPQHVWFVYGTDPAFVGEVPTVDLPDVRVLGLGGYYQEPRVAVGDCDGDGADDVLLGLPDDGGTGLHEGETPLTGAVLVLAGPVHGAAEAWDAADMVVLGPALGGGLGSDLDAVDIDSDGAAELVVGNPGEDSAAFDEGAVYVVDVALGGTLDLQQGGWRARAVGDGDGRRLGTSVVGPGDVDGDGHDDFAAGMVADGGFWLFFGGPER